MLPRSRTIRALAALAILGLLASRATAELMYCPTPIPGLGEPRSLNDAGYVVGSTNWSPRAAAALFDGHAVHNLGTLGGPYGAAFGVNASGQVVGRSLITDPFRMRAFLYDGKGMHDLGTLGGYYSGASGINDAGHVVGDAFTANVVNHAFRYASGTMFDLGTLGGNNSTGTAINASDQVVGSSQTSDGAYHAFFHDGTVMHDLGTLGGTTSRATGVNDSGQVVGSSTVHGDTGYHAFLYSKGAMADLGTLGGDESWALGINAAGDVVGSARTATGEQHPFLYRDGVMTDLNGLFRPWYGFRFYEGVAINDQGEILVKGSYRTSGAGAFLLRPSDTCGPFLPSPEPASLTLLSIGALSVLGYAWQRRRRSAVR